MTGQLSEASPGDHRDARDVAAQAGRLLIRLREELGYGDPDHLRQEGDRRAHELIASRLASLHPADPVLSEEGSDDLRRLQATRLWVIDPLDGTREFAEAGRDDFAVHVCLVVDGVPAAGAVALPARDLVLSTAEPPVLPPLSGRPRLLISRSRPDRAVVELARRLDAELIEMGSAGAKAMAVVLGEAEIYGHAGGMYEWDSAAPVAVATAAGLIASRFDGSPLIYNQRVPSLPDLLIYRLELAALVEASITAISQPPRRSARE